MKNFFCYKYNLLNLSKVILFSFSCILAVQFTPIFPAQAYPIFAQQNYPNPREANGRIVCANCHLAQKPVEIEIGRASCRERVSSKV